MSIGNPSAILEILWDAFANLPGLRLPPIRAVLYRQIYFVGIEAINRMVFMGVLVGGMLIVNITDLVGFDGSTLTGKLIVWLVVRELGPLLTAIIVITRSATAISAELGAMSVNGEIENLEIMGVDCGCYLIMPRVLGLVLASVALTFYFEFSALFGGYILASLLLEVPFEEFLSRMIAALTLIELLVSLVKGFCFGLVIAVMACYHGLRVGSSITGIPQAITKATSQGLFLVLLIDILMAALMP